MAGRKFLWQEINASNANSCCKKYISSYSMNFLQQVGNRNSCGRKEILMAEKHFCGRKKISFFYSRWEIHIERVHVHRVPAADRKFMSALYNVKNYSTVHFYHNNSSNVHGYAYAYKPVCTLA